MPCNEIWKLKVKNMEKSLQAKKQVISLKPGNRFETDRK
jgi:hypothetical protein